MPSMDTTDIYMAFHLALIASAKFNFRVICLIADGAQGNRQLQNRLFTNTDVNVICNEFIRWMQHPCFDCRIYFVSDPSHMIKKIVSSFNSDKRVILMEVTKSSQFSSSNVTDNDHYPYYVDSSHIVSTLCLQDMYKLWCKFNHLGGLKVFNFTVDDFCKNKFQAMRVGPCIKVLGPKMIEMIDEALRCRNAYIEGMKEVMKIQSKISYYLLLLV